MRSPSPTRPKASSGGHGVLGQVGDDRNVLSCRKAGDQVVELEYEAHVFAAKPGERPVIRAGETMVEVPDIASGWGVESPKDVQERGFPTAGRAQQHDELPGKQVQVDTTQGMHLHLSHAIDLG